MIVCNRQGAQQQGPESPTITPPGMRVNTRKLHQRYILKKKGCPYWYKYPPFPVQPARKVCKGIEQKHFVFETRHSPEISKLAQHINTHIHVSLRVNCCNLKQNCTVGGVYVPHCTFGGVHVPYCTFGGVHVP